MTPTETLSHVLHGVRTGQIIAWLDDGGEIRLITAEQATAAQRSVALSAAACLSVANLVIKRG